MAVVSQKENSKYDRYFALWKEFKDKNVDFEHVRRRIWIERQFNREEIVDKLKAEQKHN